MAKHAFLSPSAAHRWLHCTSSPYIESKLPDTAGKAAAEGTLAHAICEAFVKSCATSFRLGLPIDPDEEHAGIMYHSINGEYWEENELFSPEMVEIGKQYATEVMSIYAEMFDYCEDPEIHVEQMLSLELIPDDQCFGTADCIIIANDQMHVIDYKHGKGVEVSADRNPQMMIYGLAALEEYQGIYDIETVCLHIFQPRIGNYSGWNIPAKDLVKWGDEVLRPAALKALGFNGRKSEMEAGTWCKFCRAKARCKVLADYSLNISGECKGAELMTLDEIAALLPKLKTIKEWADAVEGYALDQALKGDKITGYKLVEGRSVRKISDEEGLVTRLLDEGIEEELIYKPKELQTLSALEKAVGKKKFCELSEGYVVKPQGKPTLVPESDKRKELLLIESDLANLNLSDL